MIKFLDLNTQYQSIKPEIDAAIAAVIEESAFIGGRHVRQFEEDFGNWVGSSDCIGVANGTRWSSPWRCGSSKASMS